MDLPIWAYIIFAITGAAGFISLMWFSFFADKIEKWNFISDVNSFYIIGLTSSLHNDII